MPRKKNYSNYSKVNIAQNLNGVTFYSGTTDKLVVLDKHNFNIINSKISANPYYNHKFDEAIFDFYCKMYNNVFPFSSKKAVEDVIIMVDFMNSTNKWRMRRYDVIEAIAEYISSSSFIFEKRIQNDISLVDDMNTFVKKISRTNEFSICSKVCRFFNQKLFPNNDTYYAWDNVVREVIPYYDNKLATKFAGTQWSKYIDFYNDIEKLRMKNGVLTRFELDQILWYCHR